MRSAGDYELVMQAKQVIQMAVLALLLTPLGLAAAEDETPNGDASESLLTRWMKRIDASALVEMEAAFGTRGGPQKLELKFEPELNIDLPYELRLTAIGRVRGDAFDKLETGDPLQSEISHATRRLIIGDRTDLELREFYVEATVGRTYLTVGKQQIVWGKADGLKVLDVVNPQDFSEFVLDDFDDSRIPLWSVNAEIPIKNLVVQLIWIPDRTYHKLPEPGSAYEFTAPAFRPVAPPGVAVELRPVERPGRFFADSDAGVRLSTFWKGWDLTANYLYHYDDFPVLFRGFSVSPQGPRVTVTPRYERTHLVGGTFSNAFGNLTMRGELGYSFDRFLSTSDPADADGVIKSDVFSYVLGFDWYGIQETLLSFQIFQNFLTHDDPGLLRDRAETNLSALFQREFRNDTVTAETIWVHNFDRGDGFVRPKVSYELRNNVDVFHGSGNGLFGQFDRNDRLVLGIEWGI